MPCSTGLAMLLAQQSQKHLSRSLCSPSSACTLILFTLATLFNMQILLLQSWYWLMADMRCQDVECWCAGIPEDALLDELDALLPASALRLLSVLEREGLLSMRSAAQPAPRIPWILMRHNQAAEPSGKVSTPILSAVSLQRLHGLCSTLPENINLHQSGLASPLVGAGCAPLLPSRG